MKKTTPLLMFLVSSFMLIQASQQAPKREKIETTQEQDAQKELSKAAEAQVAQQDATDSQDSDSDYFGGFSSPSSSPVPMSYVIGWTEEELAKFDDPKNKIYVTKEQIANCGYKQAPGLSTKGAVYESL